MLRGAPRGKDAQRRLRKSVRRTRASSTDRRTQTSSAAGQGGEGRTFSINPTKNPSTLVSEAKRVAKEQCNLQGGYECGSFSGKGVKGRYNIEGRTVKVTITDKPTLASWSTVESKVKEFFR